MIVELLQMALTPHAVGEREKEREREREREKSSMYP